MAGTSNNNTTADTSSDPVHDGMQWNSLIPVPTMVTQSILPYATPNRGLLTAVPAEVMERIAFNLDATSILALRLTNKAAKLKSESSFVKTCLHTINIDKTNIVFRRGFNIVQAIWAGTGLKQVISTMPTQTNSVRSGSKLIVPSRNDVKTVIDHMSNVTARVLRDPTHWSSLPNTLCQALTTSPRKHLTDLIIDGCVLSVEVLTNLLNAHRKTLQHLSLRNVQFKNAESTLDLLKSRSSDFELARLVRDPLAERQWLFTVVYPNQSMARDNKCISVSRKSKRTGVLQSYALMEDSASMTGYQGVKDGFARILILRP